MFKNIGKKFKNVARIIFIFECIASIIPFWIIMDIDSDLWFLGVLSILFVILFAWFSVCFLYAFGEIVDKLTDIEKNTRIVIVSDVAEHETTIEPIVNSWTSENIEWECVCGMNNVGNGSFCVRCGQARK